MNKSNIFTSKSCRLFFHVKLIYFTIDVNIEYKIMCMSKFFVGELYSSESTELIYCKIYTISYIL